LEIASAVRRWISVDEGQVAGRGGESLAQQLARAFDRLRLAVVVALRLVAAFGAQAAELLLALDGIRAGRHAEAAAETEHGLHDRDRVRVALQVADEGAVDL